MSSRSFKSALSVYSCTECRRQAQLFIFIRQLRFHNTFSEMESSPSPPEKKEVKITQPLIFTCIKWRVRAVSWRNTFCLYFSLSFQHLLFPSLVLFIYFSLAATAAASSWCFTVFNSLPKMVNIREERCQHDDVVSGVADMHFIVNATNESILKLRIDVNRFLGRVRINHFPFYVYGNQMVFGRLTQSTPAPNRRFTKK